MDGPLLQPSCGPKYCHRTCNIIRLAVLTSVDYALNTCRACQKLNRIGLGNSHLEVNFGLSSRQKFADPAQASVMSMTRVAGRWSSQWSSHNAYTFKVASPVSLPSSL